VDEAIEVSRHETLAALGLTQAAPSDLFPAAHVERWTPLLLAYAPIGAALAVLRMAAWVGGIALDAPWFRSPAVVSAYLTLLGVTVTWRGEENIPQQVGAS
jgi:hypothetical protein